MRSSANARKTAKKPSKRGLLVGRALQVARLVVGALRVAALVAVAQAAATLATVAEAGDKSLSIDLK
jgi:hypothetical protein